MGPAEAALLTELERTATPVLRLSASERARLGLQGARARDLLHRLSAKGWLLPIERGKFLLVPRAAVGTWVEEPFVVANGIAPQPCYVSYWSALSFHGLSEQLPRVVFVVTRGRPKPPVEFQGREYDFIPLRASAFYGYAAHEFVALNGAARVEVNVADPEKALLDSLERELLAGGMREIIHAARNGLQQERINVKRLIDYSVRYPNAAVIARAGYIFERLGVPEVAVLRSRIRRRGEIPSLSIKGRRRTGPIDPTWRLRINVDLGTLEEE